MYVDRNRRCQLAGLALTLGLMLPVVACSQPSPAGDSSPPPAIDDPAQPTQDTEPSADVTDESSEGALPNEHDASTIEAFESLLVDSLNARDISYLAAMMGDPFGSGLWLSEFSPAPPADAAEQVVLQFLPAEGQISISDPQPDLAELLGRPDPDGVWGPDVEILATRHSLGWGADGQGEALLAIARHPDSGSPYWHALIVAPLGFDLGR